ncbi:MAG: ERF family protein, partial [Proteobacteria bacterium]|nr:ERF family protein [Pseudomonadota bacterium]
MQKSESIAALAAALAEAQGEMENASKNSENQHFRSKYADLAEVLNTVRPVLSRHGLSVTQFPSYGDGLVHVETIIAHKSGEWMSEKCSTPAQKQDPQGVGSAISYLRRYSLAAVCGIAQEDDDANAATKPKATVAKPTPATGQRPAPAPVQEPMM